MTWPHRVVYNSEGQIAVYEEMSSILFVNGYLTIKGEKTEEVKGHMLQHLQDLMEDAEAYSWECQ